MGDFKAAYCDQWAKAARNVLFTLEQIKPFVSFPFAIEAGFGATSSEYEAAEHERSEPDIMIRHYAEDSSRIVAAIEVTGTEKMIFPCIGWVAEHKLQYANAKAADFPIVYVLFFANQIRFVTAETMLKHGCPIKKTINGNEEQYRSIGSKSLEPFPNLKPWLIGILNKVIEE
jgi:hypothetical protein